MATIATTTMAMLNAKCLSTSSPTTTTTHLNPSKPATITSTRPISLLSVLPKNLLTTPKSMDGSNPLTAAAIAGSIFSTLSSSDSALAAQQIADLAEGDNRGLALLLPIIPAILWVLYNILQPALNQVNRMRSEKGVVVGLGIGGGLAASGFLLPPGASAGEVAMIAEASNDSRGLLLLFVIAPAVAWVLYNILQPALNQINRMRSG